MLDSAGTPARPSSATSASRSRTAADPAGTGSRPTPTTPTTPVAVVVASAGRPNLVTEVVRSCAEQRGAAFTGILSVPDAASLPVDRDALRGWRTVTGVRGLAAQRNAALEVLDGVDLVAFFDDDAVLRSDYLANAVRFLDDHPEVLGLTGRVVLDGATSGEVDRADAAAALQRSTAAGETGRWRPTRELYGCNFVVRADAAVQLRFDQRLPLYSWLEDHDFARRLLRLGRHRHRHCLAQVDDCVIVHRAATSGGRQAHRRLGYSQVMNPAYLHRKGSFPLWLAAQQVVRPVAKNIALSVLPGAAASWRRERLSGNGLAVLDLLRGRITPERIRDL